MEMNEFAHGGKINLASAYYFRKKMKLKQHSKNYEFIIGIDEVGRGALAGPLFVAGVLLKRNFRPQNILRGKPLLDSKKLSPHLRQIWYQKIKEKNVPFVVCKVNPQTIDKINISQATNLAAKRCLKKIYKKYKNVSPQNVQIFLDGGIFVKGGKTIIKGDEKINAIKLASIVAKVKRDELMKKLSKKYDNYCFYENKGYGTKEHIAALKKFGMSKIHRKTFCKFLEI